MLMRVVKYAPHKLYGFAESDDGHRVFFHVQVFQPGPTGPPPIIGELVQVTAPDATEGSAQSPRASRVVRIGSAVKLAGVVEDFNSNKGWGFIRDQKGKSYYLHRSEVLGGKLPLQGRRVAFYEGTARGRPRACYVEVDP